MKRIRYFFSVVLYQILHGIMHLLPAKNIVFESIPNFADNTYFLYQKLLEMGYNRKYHFYWLVRDLKNCPPPEELPKHVHILLRHAPPHQSDDQKKSKLWTIWYSIVDKIAVALKVMEKANVLMRAKFIIDCNDYVYKLDSRTTRIHLKHGLPIKDASYYTHQIGEVDFMSVPSAYFTTRSALPVPTTVCSSHSIITGTGKQTGAPDITRGMFFPHSVL